MLCVLICMKIICLVNRFIHVAGVADSTGKLYLRKKYIRRYYWQRPNMLKFIELMSTEHCKTLKNLSVFIEKGFRLRKELLLS